MLVALDQSVRADLDRDRLALLAGREGDVAVLGDEVSRAGLAVDGLVIHGYFVRRGFRKRQHEARDRTARRASVARRILVELVFDGREVAHLRLVHGVPVVVQDAPGVARVGVPRPEGPARPLLSRRQVGRAVVVEVAAKIRGDRFQPRRILRVHQLGAELADPHGRDAFLVDVAPHLVELGGQVRREVGALEPGLLVDRVGIVVRRVDQLVVEREVDRPVAHAHQVAAPPIALAVVGADAFDEDQPVGVHRADGVAGRLRRQRPVVGAAAAPGTVVRLVVQVRTDDRLIVGIARRQHLPVVDPGRLRILAVVPQAILGRAGPGIAAVMVEDDLEADLVCIVDDLVHDLQRRQALQVRVLAEVDAVRRGRRMQHLAREGHADGVEAQIHHLVHHVLVAARPQAVRREGRRFEAEPVHAGDLHRVSGRVDDLVARGAEPAGRRPAAGIALDHRRVGNAERRAGRRIVVDDRAGTGRVGDGRAGRARQDDAEAFVGFNGRITGRGDLNRLLRLARCEGERARLRDIVAAGKRRAVGRREIHGDRRGGGRGQAHGEAGLPGRCRASFG